MAKKKFYAVAVGVRPGIYGNWPEAEAQVKGFGGAKYKGFVTREEAVDYLVDEGLLHPGYAQAEVTRYTSWPGQACSYKIGQLKFLELRTMMEESLGSKYDIRDFHHLVLGQGSMPLYLIEEQVVDYINDNK